MAEAIQQNATLQSFDFDASDTRIDNETGVAMAGAIQQNTTLQSFDFDASDTRIDNETGIAMAESLKENATLQSFVFKLVDSETIEAHLNRNAEVRTQRQALARL